MPKFLLIAGLVFLLIFFVIVSFILTGLQNDRLARTHQERIPASFQGRLSIRSMENIMVGGYRVVLCGVSSRRVGALQGLIVQTVRKEYEQLMVSCKTVGNGTPCDGRSTNKAGSSLIVQCVTPSGSDLALEFSERGFLCDEPTQSGGRYKACPSQ